MKKLLSLATFFRFPEFLALIVFFLIPLQKAQKYKPSATLKSFLYPQEGLVPNLGEKIWYYQVDILILVLALFSLLHYRKKIAFFFLGQERKFFSLFCLWCVATTFFSGIPNFQLQYFRLIDLFLGLLLFCSLSSLEPRRPLQFFNILAWGSFVISFIPCVIGISHYFLQKPLGLHFLGESKWMCSPFSVADGTTWLGERLFSSPKIPQLIQRSHGTFDHPNIFGGYLLIPIFLTLFLLTQENNRKVKAGLIFGLAIQAFALWLTFSRAALYAGIIGVACLCFVLLLRKEKVKTLLLAFGFVMIASFILLYPQIRQRGGVVNYSSLAKVADQERIIYQKAGLSMIKNYPWRGVGFNNSLIVQSGYYKDALPIQHSRIHNIYLLIAVETGVIGIALFATFLLFLFIPFLRGMSLTSLPFACIGLALLLVGLCDYYPFANPLGKTFFFGSLGFFSLANSVAGVHLRLRERQKQVD